LVAPNNVLELETKHIRVELVQVRSSPTNPFYNTKICAAVNLGILSSGHSYTGSTRRSLLFYVAIRQSHDRDRAARSCVEMDVAINP